jgi:hypothetical protein
MSFALRSHVRADRASRENIDAAIDEQSAALGPVFEHRTEAQVQCRHEHRERFNSQP